jgi:hypothetical protein|tara:strand:- start:1725 stop:2798 length:1074 start_codon:yes stop_codon:yes gene_type:complete
MTDCVAPFPWFGGKRRVAALVWERFGRVANYVEPFFGSGAVLLGRPGFDPAVPPVETVNDADGLLCNFWRAVAAAPEEVARWADWPVNENDQHARHAWLVERKADLAARLEGDPDHYDAKVAGWWVWGINCWIGSGWCSGDGPWEAVEVAPGDRQLVHVSNAGQGIHRQRVHVGNTGLGIHRKRVHVGNAGRGAAAAGEQGIEAWFAALSERLRRVRVACGDWRRVCDSEATLRTKGGITAVFVDPPYSGEERTADLYAEDSGTVAADVREWCRRWGRERSLRIALCGYAGEGHDALTDDGWESVAWKAHGGYGSQGGGAGRANKRRERIWFSPGCLRAAQADLFAGGPPVQPSGEA